MKDVSIVIVNYNVRYFLARCLESVYNSNLGGLDIDIYVVDNASVDGSVDMVRKDYPDVNLIASPDNLGFSKGNNLALRQIISKYALLLNPDTIVEEDTIKICYDYMEAHEKVGALGVKMIDGTGRFLPESKRALPSLWNSTTKLTGLAQLFPRSATFNGYALGHLSEDKQHDIQVLCGAFMFMKGETLDKVGLLDEAFFMYGEDIDLSYRILQADYEIHYIPDTKIIHYKGESTKKSSLNYVKTFYGAMSIYVAKHYNGASGQWLAWLIHIGIYFRAGLSMVKRFIERILPGTIDGVLIYLGLYTFGQIWAKYYFHQADYFDNKTFYYNIVSYALLWPLALSFLGYYKKRNWRKRIEGIFAGLMIVLAIYALLPETYRSSRTILLAGTIIVTLVTVLTSLIFGQAKNKDKKKILVVAKKETADKILNDLDKYDVEYDNQGIVNPISEKNNEYINNIDALDELVRVLKIDEVIFSTDDMPMRDIMNRMMQLGSKVTFKIAGDENLSIIGSNSKNKTGELYSVDVRYNLSEEYHQHVKRSFDIISSVICIILFPILILINRLRMITYLKNVIGVIFGVKTMVGYRSGMEDYKNLPILSPAVLKINKLEHQSDRDANLNYARAYNVWQDAELFFKNLQHIAS